MSTWRNWLRTLLPWAEKSATQSTFSSSPTRGDSGSTGPAVMEPVYPSPEVLWNALPPQIPLLPIKQWTLQHISPYAWDRAMIRTITLLQKEKIALPEVLHPSPQTRVPASVAKAILLALRDMYGIEPAAILQAIRPAIPTNSF